MTFKVPFFVSRISAPLKFNGILLCAMTEYLRAEAGSCITSVVSFYLLDYLNSISELIFNSRTYHKRIERDKVRAWVEYE